MPRKSPNVAYVRKDVLTQLPKWGQVDDTVDGATAVKKKGEAYLPKPDTNSDKARNEELYKKYLKRAVFFPVTSRTLAGLSGQVFSKPLIVDLPNTLQSMEDDIDGSGTTLEQQTKESLNNVLKHGRCGLLSDFPMVDGGEVVTRANVEQGGYSPKIITYSARQIINWREAAKGGKTVLSMVTLQENKITEDDGFEFKYSPRWRVYNLDESGFVVVTVWKMVDDSSNGGEIEYEIETQAQLIGANEQPLTIIPFAFIGSTNNDSNVDESPLYPLSDLNIAHYRNSADYEQSLFLVGQATPVFTGLTDQWVKDHIAGKVTLGSSNAVSLPKDATFGLMQAEANSMPMEGMLHKEDQMKAIGAKLIEPNTVERTATEVEIEATSEASVLSNVSKNVSAAYEDALYYCSLFNGEVEPDNITVELNSEFQLASFNAAERAEVVAAWQSGLLTFEEARNVYRRKNIATEDDEQAAFSVAGDNTEI